MENFWKDFSYSLRTLRKSPGFTMVAVVSIALGIGANTTIFTLINSVFLNPLPVEATSELYAVYTTDENNPGQFSNMLPTSYPNYRDWRDQNEVFSGLAAYTFPLTLNLARGEEAEQIFTEMVSGNYFEVLGVRPVLGRFFLPEEDRTPGTHPVVVMSYNLWARLFSKDPAVLGMILTVNGQGYTVVGVAPQRFKGVNAIGGPELWVPTMMHQQVVPQQFRSFFDDRRGLLFNVAGRLKPGVTRDEADANIRTIANRLEQEYPEPNSGRSAALIPLAQATVFPGIRDYLLLGGAVLMTVVGLVLLIACSNVANLLLAKATARRKEIAIRLSMGAGRKRLIRQLLTESILMSLMGGAVGLGLAFWGRDFIWSFRPPFLTQNTLDLALDTRVLVFTLVVSLMTGVVFGLVPALQTSKTDVVETLKEETRTAGRGRRRWGLRNTLVVAQVALSLVALVAAGLFLRSLQGAHQIDPGFEIAQLAIMTLNVGQRGYDQPKAERFYREIVERVRSLPVVRSVSLASNLPLFGGFQRSVFIEGQDQDREKGILVLTNTIDLDYLETAGIPLLRGRNFTAADREDSVSVAIINEKMAEQFWPGQDAVGKRFRFYGDEFYREVVGIARNSKYVTLGEEPQSCAYTPWRQDFADNMTLYVRSESDPAAALGAAQREVKILDPQVPVTFPMTVSEFIDQSLWASKLGAALLTVLGALALVLASVGLYGVMAFSVSQRHQEIGIRMAMGAAQPDVLRLILKQGMALVGIGVVSGLAAALAVSRVVSSLLYGVSPSDPTTFTGVALLLVTVALIASYLPARRASRVDPLVALRYQ